MLRITILAIFINCILATPTNKRCAEDPCQLIHDLHNLNLPQHVDYSRPGNWSEQNQYATDRGHGKVHEEYGQYVDGTTRVRYFKKNITGSYGGSINPPDYSSDSRQQTLDSYRDSLRIADNLNVENNRQSGLNVANNRQSGLNVANNRQSSYTSSSRVQSGTQDGYSQNLNVIPLQNSQQSVQENINNLGPRQPVQKSTLIRVPISNTDYEHYSNQKTREYSERRESHQEESSSQRHVYSHSNRYEGTQQNVPIILGDSNNENNGLNSQNQVTHHESSQDASSWRGRNTYVGQANADNFHSSYRSPTGTFVTGVVDLGQIKDDSINCTDDHDVQIQYSVDHGKRYKRNVNDVELSDQQSSIDFDALSQQIAQGEDIIQKPDSYNQPRNWQTERPIEKQKQIENQANENYWKPRYHNKANVPVHPDDSDDDGQLEIVHHDNENIKPFPSLPGREQNIEIDDLNNSQLKPSDISSETKPNKYNANEKMITSLGKQDYNKNKTDDFPRQSNLAYGNKKLNVEQQNSYNNNNFNENGALNQQVNLNDDKSHYQNEEISQQNNVHENIPQKPGRQYPNQEFEHDFDENKDFIQQVNLKEDKVHHQDQTLQQQNNFHGTRQEQLESANHHIVNEDKDFIQNSNLNNDYLNSQIGNTNQQSREFDQHISNHKVNENKNQVHETSSNEYNSHNYGANMKQENGYNNENNNNHFQHNINKNNPFLREFMNSQQNIFTNRDSEKNNDSEQKLLHQFNKPLIDITEHPNVNGMNNQHQTHEWTHGNKYEHRRNNENNDEMTHPMHHQHNPMNHQHNPMNHQHNQMNHQHNPMNHQHNPMNHQHNPMNHQHNPRNHQHNPMNHQHNPFYHQHDHNKHNPIFLHNPLFHQQNPISSQYNQMEKYNQYRQNYQMQYQHHHQHHHNHHRHSYGNNMFGSNTERQYSREQNNQQNNQDNTYYNLENLNQQSEKGREFETELVKEEYPTSNPVLIPGLDNTQIRDYNTHPKEKFHENLNGFPNVLNGDNHNLEVEDLKHENQNENTELGLNKNNHNTNSQQVDLLSSNYNSTNTLCRSNPSGIGTKGGNRRTSVPCDDKTDVFHYRRNNNDGSLSYTSSNHDSENKAITDNEKINDFSTPRTYVYNGLRNSNQFGNYRGDIPQDPTTESTVIFSPNNDNDDTQQTYKNNDNDYNLHVPTPTYAETKSNDRELKQSTEVTERPQNIWPPQIGSSNMRRNYNKYMHDLTNSEFVTTQQPPNYQKPSYDDERATINNTPSPVDVQKQLNDMYLNQYASSFNRKYHEPMEQMSTRNQNQEQQMREDEQQMNEPLYGQLRTASNPRSNTEEFSSTEGNVDLSLEPRILEAYGGNGKYNKNHGHGIFRDAKMNPSATLPPLSDGEDPWVIDEKNSERVIPLETTPWANQEIISKDTQQVTTAAPSFWNRLGHKITNSYDKAREKARNIFG